MMCASPAAGMPHRRGPTFAPDGNGRTARAAAMLVLYSRLRVDPVSRPGRPTFLELLGWNKLACNDALEAADAAWQRGVLEVGELEDLLMKCLTDSLVR